MARNVEIVVPSNRTDSLLEGISALEPLIGLQVQRSSSIKPVGDVINVTLPNESLSELMQLLHERGVGLDEDSSISSSEPVGVVSEPNKEVILAGRSDASWEEMQGTLAKEGNMTVNALLLMLVAGAVSAIGIQQGAVHLVLAGMVVAPGFEPLTKIGLGIAAGGGAAVRGVVDTVKGYSALLLGSLLAALLLMALGSSPLEGQASYDSPGALIAFWTTISTTSLVVSLLSGVAGALLVATNRSVLTIGAMIGLALIPSATLLPMTLLAGDMALFWQALARWAADAVLVTATGSAVMFWQRMTVQKRRSMF